MKLEAITIKQNCSKQTVQLVWKVSGLSQDNVWLEVEDKYWEYLVVETIDAFCITFCNYAMEMNEDIQSDIPITRECYNNLNTYIKIMSDTSKFFHKINIKAPIIEKVPYKSIQKRGTGCSGGVDSFYTILNTIFERKEKLTDLVLINCGNIGGDRSQKNLSNFKKAQERASKIAKELDLSFLCIDTNIHEIYEAKKLRGNRSMYMRIMGCIAVLGKYFGYYYVAADLPLVKFVLGHEEDATALTCFLDCSMASTEALKYISIGNDVWRMEKTNYLASHHSELVKKYLSVCIFSGPDNCSRCIKCRRTMLQLSLVGDSKILNSRFNSNIFDKDINKMYAVMIANRNDIAMGFDECFAYCKKNNIKIPFIAYIMQLYYYPRYRLNKINWMRQIYLKYIKKERNT